MHIEEITAGELTGFVRSDKFKRFYELPITPQRAISQANNPFAATDDVVLILAYDDQYRLLGYVGALPEKLPDNSKIVWNTCWYAHPVLGRTIALPIFLKFVKHWEGKIVMQDLTPHTTKIIASLPYFTVIRKIPGKRVFLKGYFSELLIRRLPKLRPFKFLLLFIDGIVNLLQKIRFSFWKMKNKNPDAYTTESITDIDPETEQFIRKHNSNEVFCRDSRQIRWIMKYPWIIQKTEENKYLEKKYHFSSVARTFSIRGIKFFKDNIMCGFILVKERNSHFELPYIYAQKDFKKGLITFMKHYLIDQKAHSFTLFNENFQDMFFKKDPLPVLFTKNSMRELVVAKELAGIVNADAEIQDGDGDCAFT